jgi:Uma2 family endonuclease
MPTVLTEIYTAPAPQVPPRKRWTREQCASLESAGIWAQEKLELVDGELISKMGKNRPHSNSLWLVHQWLNTVFGAQFVNSEVPIDVAAQDIAANEPEPDLIVLNKDTLQYTANPGPQDLRLLVEISDSTLRFDLTIKAALYARAAILEYWVLDLSGRRLLVHRDPEAGKYQSITVYADGERVAPVNAPGALLSISDVLPARI